MILLIELFGGPQAQKPVKALRPISGDKPQRPFEKSINPFKARPNPNAYSPTKRARSNYYDKNPHMFRKDVEEYHGISNFDKTHKDYLYSKAKSLSKSASYSDLARRYAYMKKVY